ncbi:hypothetical protein [Mucilaginibacter humi]|uniref:hypothetical protein n=1 Tax=Mucilaginibacter humi TaxID=2732510 RepID=UPI001FECB04C|nr:hypothetical protein [Mucilaginibacter humi]
MVFISISAVLIASGVWAQKYQLAGTIIGLLSIILYLSPIVKAYRVAGTLKREFNRAFNLPEVDDRSPFSLGKMFIPTRGYSL